MEFEVLKKEILLNEMKFRREILIDKNNFDKFMIKGFKKFFLHFGRSYMILNFIINIIKTDFSENKTQRLCCYKKINEILKYMEKILKNLDFLVKRISR